MKKKLILLDIFSYSCMNCLRSLGYINKINNKYKKHGLKTIIVHTPEWDFEKKNNNILRSLKKNNIKIPVIIDKDKKIIKKLKINFWPTQVLIKDNKILYKHVGEGSYKKLEDKIRALLKIKSKRFFINEPKYSKFPTVYAGKIKNGKVSEIKDKIKFGTVYTNGMWIQKKEFIVGNGSLNVLTKGTIISFVAKSADDKPMIIKIELDNKKTRNLKIKEPQLYNIAITKNNNGKILNIETNSKLEIYSFAFR